MTLENVNISDNYIIGHIPANHPLLNKYITKNILVNSFGIKSLDDLNLFKLGHNILLHYGFNIYDISHFLNFPDNSYKHIYEYHIYDNILDNILESKFAIHRDNDNFTDFGCSTIIFYLENTFNKGGGLIIYENDEQTVTEIVNTTPIEGSIKVLLMYGDIPHNAELVYGIGVRKSIIMQIANKS